MTAATLFQAMRVTTVKIATMIIVRSVRHIARYAIRQCAWVAVLNVQIVMNQFVDTAQLPALNVKKQYVRIVQMKKIYVKLVKIIERNKKMKNRKKNQQNQRPALRFSPTAWAKLLFLRDMTHNEVGGFGITAADDLLFVTDVVLVKQKVTPVSVSFEDESVADYFEDQVEVGRQPEQFARLWLHTHPGDCPEPSGTDESTFARVFGSCDWSIMCIVAQNSSTFARLRFNAGPGGEVKVPVYVDYGCRFEAADLELWKQQYLANVVEDKIFSLADRSKRNKGMQEDEADVFGSDGSEGQYVFDDQDLLSEIDSMDPEERQYFMEELAVRSDFWNESEVLYE